MKFSVVAVALAILVLLSVLAIRFGQSESNLAIAQSDTVISHSEKEAEGASLLEEILSDEVAPSVTPDTYDLTIVMFTDYQCPYCKMMHRSLKNVVAHDPSVRIIYKDWPLFGAGSETAARMAIASHYLGKHSGLHDALMSSSGRLTEQTIQDALEEAGIDRDKLQESLARNSQSIDRSLNATRRQAAELGLSGTPALLIGSYLVPGAITEAQLLDAIDHARAFPDPS